MAVNYQSEQNTMLILLAHSDIVLSHWCLTFVFQIRLTESGSFQFC